MKRRKEKLVGIGGLKYITFLDVPVRETAHGDVIDVPYEKLEKMAAVAIIKNEIPLRGLEVKFLRKVLGLSLDAFAKEMHLTAPGILKWERAEKERLLFANEAVVRALVAEKLNIKIDGRISHLVPEKTRAEELTLSAG